MEKKNNVSEFILLGLTQDQELQKVCFGIFLIFYVAILLGNLLIIVTIKSSRHLISPMYFFLSYLSFIDICYSSVTAPKLIADLLVKKKTISFVGCIAQLFGAHFFGCTETFLLTLMAYDRYIAISKPLHYTTIMNKRVCSWMVFMSWLGGFVHSTVQTLLTIHLPFCGPNEIDHYFCDVHPLLKLACADTYIIGLLLVSDLVFLSNSAKIIILGSTIHFPKDSSNGQVSYIMTKLQIAYRVCATMPYTFYTQR
ncbi:olfactory receptor 4S2-like [Protobothrops mucrosquamatus]|uniref:olfactory receptor 4S2-like n=1 Tax=Protobothrops mucrosquamatus TaxID=103944 RepID=UPI000775AEA0|nr:olfactory receptor 4S2-like [Protobothrops mucrosquamatus]